MNNRELLLALAMGETVEVKTEIKKRKKRAKEELKLFSENTRKKSKTISLQQLELFVPNENKERGEDSFNQDYKKEEKKKERKEWEEENFHVGDQDEEIMNALFKSLDDEIQLVSKKESAPISMDGEEEGLLVFKQSDLNNHSIHYYCKALVPRKIEEGELRKKEGDRMKMLSKAVINVSPKEYDHFSKGFKLIKKKKKLGGYVIPYPNEDTRD